MSNEQTRPQRGAALEAESVTLAERLARIELLLVMQAKEALTVPEVALLLGLSTSRVNALVSQRDIPHYRCGHRVFFRKAEIDEWRLRDRVMTNAEVESRAATYVATHPMKRRAAH